MKPASSKHNKLVKLKNIADIQVYFQEIQEKRNNLSKKYCKINFNNIHSFYLGKILGTGSFGTVYKAFYPKFRTCICFKVQSKKCNLIEYNSIRHIFTSLAPNTSNLIGQCYAGYFSQSDALLILPFYSEGSLLDLVNRHLQSRSRFTPVAVLKYSHQIVSILLILLKSNCSHNDIKPDNIMIRKGKLVLIDFGKARILSKTSNSKFGHLLDFEGAADTLYTIITLSYRSEYCKLAMPRNLIHLEGLMAPLINFLLFPQTRFNHYGSLDDAAVIQALNKFELQIKKSIEKEERSNMN
ncbi:kinase-like protein [Conidiobolus coronatus NRRL 28638]|uniref:Kinase-like protein n=1 Tax=Conidiobolus coronatus (strain ATCC 28846 / CBS 209.66 / NRRL 28638) TaxID=796925 RepID=A0A137PB21_CONC2|nr:kinase-like protein [Conidiobolus coronatus NRRL 28638]|eukprot:KXN72174.1 kinase-like protein [Conidiobolus coronatus NRRL 28638]